MQARIKASTVSNRWLVVHVVCVSESSLKLMIKKCRSSKPRRASGGPKKSQQASLHVIFQDDSQPHSREWNSCVKIWMIYYKHHQHHKIANTNNRKVLWGTYKCHLFEDANKEEQWCNLPTAFTAASTGWQSLARKWTHQGSLKKNTKSSKLALRVGLQ